MKVTKTKDNKIEVIVSGFPFYMTEEASKRLEKALHLINKVEEPEVKVEKEST